MPSSVGHRRARPRRRRHREDLGCRSGPRRSRGRRTLAAARPKASSSSRLMPHLSAIISAAIPWGTRPPSRLVAGTDLRAEREAELAVAIDAPIGTRRHRPRRRRRPPRRRRRRSRPARRSGSPAGDEPHWRSTVVPGTVSGKPAASTALRAMLTPCSPTCMTQPITTSSTRAGSMPVRSISALERLRREVDRVPVLQPPVAAPERGADGVDDDGGRHDELLILGGGP